MAVFEEYSLIRDIALSFMVVTIFFALQFAIYFLREWLRTPNRKFNDLRFAWSFFLVSVAFNMSFFIMSDFYTSGEERVFWIRLGYIAITAGLAIFSNIQERALPWNTHNFFGIIGLIGVMFSFFLPHEILKYLAFFILTPIYIVLFAIFARIIIKRSVGILRVFAFLFILGFGISFLGYGLEIDFAVEAFGPISYTIGTIHLAVGVVIMSFSIMNLPSFGELDWQRKIQDIYLIHSNGTVLAHVTTTAHERKDSSMSESEKRAGGAIIGIKALLKEVTSREGTVEAIDHGDVKLLFGHTDYADLIVVSSEDLMIIRHKIENFIKEFTILYKGILKDSVEDVRIFRPVEGLIKRIFGIS